MKKSKALKILENTALLHNVSVIEVRKGIQEAIDHAYENRGESMPEFWGKWGRKPTPEEFIINANREVLDRLNIGANEDSAKH